MPARFFLIVSLFPLTFALVAAPAPPARFHEVGFRGGVKYLGPGRSERLDLYFPKHPAHGERFPGVVIIHGGGWSGGERGQSREINIGSNLARAGYVCVSIDYVLSQKNKPCWPENIRDCKRAVQYLRVHAKELHLDPARIGSIGGSAGGHLSAMLGVSGDDADLKPAAPYPGVSDRVQAAVDMYGIADLLDWRYTKPDGTPTKKLRDGSQIRMLGVTRKQNPALWKAASPIVRADPNDCPILILHGTADTTVDYLQSVHFAEQLKKIGLEHELHLIDGAKHSFDLRPQGTKHVDVRRVVLEFFDRHLRNLSPKEAAARYAALVAFEKAHPAEVKAGPWNGGPGIVRKIAADRRWFTLETRKAKTRIALDADVAWVLQKPAAVNDIPVNALVFLRGSTDKSTGRFQANSVLVYTPANHRWQYARQDRLVGRWRPGDNTLLVKTRGKNHPLTLAPKAKISLRLPATAAILVSGARIAAVTGKRFGADRYAARVVVQEP